MKRTFIARLRVDEASSFATAGQIQDRLRDLFLWTGVEVTSVTEEIKPLTGKITAIKDVRNALNVSLRDAKFLVDMAEAQQDGTAQWANVIVTCDLDIPAGLNRFRVDTDG